MGSPGVPASSQTGLEETPGPQGAGRVSPRRGSTFSRLRSLTLRPSPGFALTVLGLGEPRRRLYKEGERGQLLACGQGLRRGLGVLSWGRPAASPPRSHAEV